MDLLGGIMKEVLGDKATDIVSQFIEQQGGIQQLAHRFEQQGMGSIIQSWISNGKNLPISADQIQQILGNTHISAIASQFGFSENMVSEQLANFLPDAVDKLTPSGELNQAA